MDILNIDELRVLKVETNDLDYGLIEVDKLEVNYEDCKLIFNQ